MGDAQLHWVLRILFLCFPTQLLWIEVFSYMIITSGDFHFQVTLIVESNLLIRQEKVEDKGDYDVSKRMMDILFWDVIDPNEAVLEPNEVLLKRPAVEGSWFCEYADDCLLSFQNTYSSIGSFFPCTANQQNCFFFVLGLESGKQNSSQLVTNVTANVQGLTRHQHLRNWNKNVCKC
jgi:hypothetical protein